MTRLQAWWQGSSTKVVFDAPMSARDVYWNCRIDMLETDTRVPIRAANACPQAPHFVLSRTYDAAQILVEQWAAALPTPPCVAPDAPTVRLAQAATGALAALQSVRAGILHAAVIGRPYAGAVELALCVVLVAARRLPAYYAAQVATEIKAAIVKDGTQDEAQRNAAQAFALYRETHSADAGRVALLDDRLDELLLRQVQTSTRSAVALFVYADAQAKQWQAAMNSGRDVCEKRVTTIAATRTALLWQEPWAMPSESVYAGDALSKRLN